VEERGKEFFPEEGKKKKKTTSLTKYRKGEERGGRKCFRFPWLTLRAAISILVRKERNRISV